MEMFLALLGGVVSVLGLLLGYVSHRRHQRTRIGYRLVADSPLAQNIDGIENLGIHYDGRVLTRPRLMVLEIINVGNVPIRPDDYQDDLGVTFPEGVEIVWSSVQGTPASVTADVRVVAESVRIGRPLLNAEDVLTLQVLADGDGADVRVMRPWCGVQRGGEARGAEHRGAGRAAGVTLLHRARDSRVDRADHHSLAGVHPVAGLGRSGGGAEVRRRGG